MRPSQQALNLLTSIFPDRKEEVLDASSYDSVELEENGLVHSALIYTFIRDSDINYVFVCWIGVKNKRRGNGRRLFVKLLRDYPQDWITLKVKEDNVDARKFYEAVGFVNAGPVNGARGYLLYQRKPRRGVHHGW